MDTIIRNRDIVVIEQRDSSTVEVKSEIALSPPYKGDYIITPTHEVQKLQTKGYTMKDDIIIEPIPKNYGLISWNGRYIKVS